MDALGWLEEAETTQGSPRGAQGVQSAHAISASSSHPGSTLAANHDTPLLEAGVLTADTPAVRVPSRYVGRVAANTTQQPRPHQLGSRSAAGATGGHHT